MVLTLSGIAILLHQSEILFQALRIAGTLYLLYAGIRLLAGLRRPAGPT